MVPGSGRRMRVGTGVMGGMLTATLLAIFFVPVFFVVVRRRFTRHAEYLGYVFEGVSCGRFFRMHIGSQLNAPQSGNRHRTWHRGNHNLSSIFLHIPGLIFTIFTRLIY